MDKLISELKSIVGAENVIVDEDELLVYECDALTQHKHRPRAVVFPTSTEETAETMMQLSKHGVPFTPRGAGTGYSGGALALNRAVVIELARMRKILKIMPDDRIAVVQPGVINADVSRAAAPYGLHYVPDPSSNQTCTIGGNVAENAGGIHCLKYGTTTDHVLAATVVLSEGKIVHLSRVGDTVGYDLLGVFVGSEGTFGIATELTLKLLPVPPSVRTILVEFPEVNRASQAVSSIIAAGLMPAALEMLDKEIIRAIEASVFAAGLPADAGAALLIELDGIEAGINEEVEHVTSICRQHGARECRIANSENERKRLWAARKGAFGAMGRVAPDLMIQDAVVPRSQLPEILAQAYGIAAKYDLRLANVFHAGDGNLHPLIGFDSRSPDEVARVKEAGRDLIESCVRVGGSITGEHGVGFDKRGLLPLIFSDLDMQTMLQVRTAFDPIGTCNPGKIIPVLAGCGEGRAVESFKTRFESRAGSERDIFRGASTQPSDGPSIRQFLDTSFDPAMAQQRLLSIVGATNISVDKFAPALLVTPESVDQVCEVMQLASSERWTVLPAGAATWLNSGNTLAPINIVLSTRKLTRIIDHEPADLVAITEAGVTLRALNDELGRNGQWLPLDPPDDGRATIGGVVSTGVGGAQQFGYGAPRRHVIGMKVVRADGSLIKVGGRVVKNVAGYDLSKLFTGSFGTLGVIVEVNFKLRPVPFQTRTILASGDWKHLLACARQVIASKLFPVAVELLSPGLASMAGWSERGHVLLIKFDGSHNGVEYQAKNASAIIDRSHTTHVEVIENDVSMWRALAEMPLKLSENIISRISVSPADVELIMSMLETSNAGNERMWHASVGVGRVRVIDQKGKSADTAIADIGGLRSSAENLGGSLIVEDGPTEIRQQLGVWGDLGDSAGLMQRIKRQLDPDRILSAGRFSATI